MKGLALVGMLFAVAVAPSAVAQLGDDVFDLTDLPKGATITLPHPAVTHVPLTSEVRLTSTDMPQMIKLSGVTGRGERAPVIKVAIYDSSEGHVHHLTVQPNSYVVYMFHSLDTIRVTSKVVSKGSVAGSTLKIESNKPLEISH